MKPEELRKLFGYTPAHAIWFDGDDPDDPEDDPTHGGEPAEDDKPKAPEDDKPKAPEKGQPGGSGSTAEDDRYRQMQAELDRERKRREELEAKEKAREDAKKTELEKKEEALERERERRAALERQIEENRKRDAIRSKAASEGARSERLDAILRVVDTEKITVGDDGELLGVEALVKDTKGEFPEFFGKTSTANPETGAGKNPDRPGESDEPETDYDIGRELAKQGKQSKNRI